MVEFEYSLVIGSTSPKEKNLQEETMRGAKLETLAFKAAPAGEARLNRSFVRLVGTKLQACCKC